MKTNFNPDSKLIAWYCMAIFALFYLAVSCTGCKIGEKAVTAYKASPEFPEDCGDKFPPVFTKGKTDTVPGIIVDCDSLQAIYDAYWPLNKNTWGGLDTSSIKSKSFLRPFSKSTPPSKRMQCPPSFSRVDTVENFALTEAQRRRADILQTDKDALQIVKDKWEVTAKKFRTWFWGLLVLIIAAVGAGIYFKKFR